MSAKPRIVIAANDVTQIGGVSRVLHVMASGFSRAGYPVELLGMNRVNEEVSYVGESDLSRGFLTGIAYSANPPSRAKDPVRWSELRTEAKGYLRAFLDRARQEPTILIVLQVYVMEHLLEAGFKPGEAGEPPVFGMYHNSYDACVRCGDIKRVKKSYGNATRFLCLTQRDRDLYAYDGMTNASYIYNPVELIEQPRKRMWQDRRNVVVFVGRFSAQKNIPRLIRAWATIADRVGTWKLDLYGVGEDEPKIAQLIFDLGLSASVRLRGRTQHPEEVLSDSKIMVMSSEDEGLPVVIVEAGLCGTPAVVTDCAPGMSVLVKDGVTGFVVPKTDEWGFGAQILRLIEDQQLNEKFGKAAFQHMRAFAPERIVSEWEQVFRQSNLYV